MNAARLGQLVAEQIGAIEDDYGEQGEIRAVCSVVEVVGPNGQEVRVRTNCGDGQSALNLLLTAQANLLVHMTGGPAQQ